MTEIELTRRRIVAGILVIGLAAAAAGVGTFALFSDESTSDNDINAGTLELTEVTDNFTVSNLYPTQHTETKTITTSYSGEVTSNLTVYITVTDDSSFAQQLDVESANITVGGENVKKFTANTLDGLVGTYENLSTLNDEETIKFNGNFTLGEDTKNKYQGNSVNLTVTFNATQQT